MWSLIKNGDFEGVKRAIASNSSLLNEQDRHGETLLIMTVRQDVVNRDIRITRLLIDHGAALDLQDENGWTALMFACRYNQPQTAQLLVQKGAVLDLQNKDGWTALMLACQEPAEKRHSKAGLLKCMQVCYAAGARTDCKNSDGDDALALARYFKREDAVAFLEFVLGSEMSTLVLKELGIGRPVIVSLYKERVRTIAACKELCELASGEDLDKFGFTSTFEKKKFVKRFNPAALKRASLFGNRSRETAGVSVENNKKHQIEACIVRIMKSRKQLSVSRSKGV